VPAISLWGGVLLDKVGAERENAMSVTTNDSHDNLLQSKSRFNSTITLMAVSAVILSASVIIYFNSAPFTEHLGRIYSSLELAAITLVPYMISAAVAAITAIGILAMVPMRHIFEPVSEIKMRLHKLACGDLTSRVPVKRKNNQLIEVVSELNDTIGALGQQIAEWKLINRKQWDILQRAYQAAARDDCENAKRYIEQMEDNWREIAKIEETLVT